MDSPNSTGEGNLPQAPAGRSGWPWSGGAAGHALDQPAPKITVVTPSFGQARFLEECIRSILAQGYPNLEYIVIDGGSRDGSREIIERYSPHLAYWQSKPDGGQGDAINQGFERATGEILGWINSDDLLLPGALFSVAEAFGRKETEIVYGDALNAFEEDNSIQYWQGYWIIPSFLQFGGLISSHAVFWRKSAHVPIWRELNCNIDGELWRRLVPGRRLKYVPIPLGVCRHYGDTKSLSPRWTEKWKLDEQLIRSRYGPPNLHRLFRLWFSKSQRIFKAVNWMRQRAKRRAVMAECGWETRRWRGPRP